MVKCSAAPVDGSNEDIEYMNENVDIHRVHSTQAPRCSICDKPTEEYVSSRDGTVLCLECWFD